MLQSQTVNHLEEIRKIHFKGTIWWSGCYLLPAKLLQSCPTLCDPIDGSPPGFPVPGILQARPLEWVAISFSKDESEKWKWSCSVVSDSSWPHGLQHTRLLHPWDFPGKSTGVGWHCLLLNDGQEGLLKRWLPPTPIRFGELGVGRESLHF